MSVLEQLGDEYLVLFSFQSLGPQRRGVDAAAISPWGVDVIEIKDKRDVRSVCQMVCRTAPTALHLTVREAPGWTSATTEM